MIYLYRIQDKITEHSLLPTFSALNMSRPSLSVNSQKLDTPMQQRLKFDVFEQASSAKVEMFKTFDVPLLADDVTTEFSTSNEGFKEGSMDLNELCVKHPTATYYVRASGDSMQGVGIHDCDVLVVDRSLRAVNGNIVVAALNGDFTTKVLSTEPQLCLEPRNDAYSVIEICDDDDFEIFGVVTFIIHSTLA